MPEGEEVEQQEPIEGLEVTTKVPAPPPPPAPTRKPTEPKLTFTEEEVEALLQKERDKVNPKLSKLDTLESQLAQIQAESAEKQKAEEKAQKEAAKAAKAKEEEEMELRDLLNRQREEFDAKLAEERAERERMAAMVDKERAYAALQGYLSHRMADESGEIIARASESSGWQHRTGDRRVHRVGQGRFGQHPEQLHEPSPAGSGRHAYPQHHLSTLWPPGADGDNTGVDTR